MRKVMITAAVVGTSTTKETNPAIPYTPREIAAAALECYEAGAASAHIHVRDPQTGSAVIPSLELQDALYKEVMERIREKSDMIINLSCSKVGLSEPNLIEKRLRIVELRPDVCSLHGEAAFFEAASKKLREYGVRPEMELFGPEDTRAILDYLKKGWFAAPISFQINLGSSRGLDNSAESLLTMKNLLPENGVMSVAAHKAPEQSPFLQVISMLLGGNIRTGLEDNIYVKKGELAKSSAQLVENVVKLVHQLNYEVATADEARKMLGIPR